MSAPPERPKIYHITHVDNLAGIVAEGGLLSDRAVLDRSDSVQMIGMSAIKKRRLEEIEVYCYAGTNVGDYVPFYFCPRSVMLYVIYRANHPELTYRGGQNPIVHLEADLYSAVERADKEGIAWAFSLSNAGAYYVAFRSTKDELHELDWTAIEATDFRSNAVKEPKQAEFLFYERFPFDLVERIGVRSAAIRSRALEAIQDAGHQPPIDVRPNWYY